MSNLMYKGIKTKEISFPLGGIGTGCIGLSGNGRLIDWEIFNKPNKGSVNGFSHFAIKAESGNKVVDARVLNSDYLAPYIGKYRDDTKYSGYGFGPDRFTMAGVPHFCSEDFEGEFPIAKLIFNDEKFPGNVIMTAFNPFIPLNDKDSSIPAAFFEFEIKNTTNEVLDYTVCLSLANPHALGTTINSYSKNDTVHMINMSSDALSTDDLGFGEVTIATDTEDVSYQEYWYRGAWFDNVGVFWQDFKASPKFNNRTYDKPVISKIDDTCSLAAHVKINKGECGKIRFIISWNYPNRNNYWKPVKCDCDSSSCTPQNKGEWKNYYASLFKTSTESATYSLKNWNRLFEETLKFKNALFSSTLPLEAIDAVSANISILKTPTCLRLEDGAFYGFEGCTCKGGCCEGSCTHVWNYAYALPFLFPKLERSMRDLDFKYNQRNDGNMGFRIQLPIGRERSAFRACADGQFGGVIKAYRDWKICGDTKWLKSNWEAIKKSIDYAWSETNEDKWDADKDGVLEGRQHHTLDMELFGPNSWLTGFYLAALKAGSEMAEFLGEKEKANEYLELFHKGSTWANTNLFNGEYYFQQIDLKDSTIFKKYIIQGSKSDGIIAGNSRIQAYWNDEAKELKYQIGEGCGVDQVVAQWHANICGLGDIFDKEKTKKALNSIYKYNFKRSMRNYFNPCRLYSLNDEAGVVICDWPEGKYKPVIPLTYAEETMNGFEYQAACHMIREGLIEEGMEIVKAIRERYDGEKRNLWNEFECGSNYARSMASYDLLLAFSGFEYDLVKGMVGFNPINIPNEGFNSFWSLETGWGSILIKPRYFELNVAYGKLGIKYLKLPFLNDKMIKSAKLGDIEIGYRLSDGIIEFEDYISIENKDKLFFITG